ncbi:hypothetical protein NA57DRAFT_62580 [Rhizodiscina lignyota]|uniref:Phospholipid/glycerol acyltransferase domain-containing protein n=1 Tax=Rhizodiscina lignyota TaxID=1504668 RepID=A0A9P4IPG3_9PEZI|nr:hypothetical protein NA57DRAFT_62580 [Rhizodiscina lignyota]
MNAFVYDLFLWLLSIVVDLFFREIHPRSSWKIPRKGPVVFVAAPHANQFVDPLILSRTIRLEAHRRVAWLIAAASMKREFIGTAAGLMGSVPVGRIQDELKSAEGKIYLPDPTNDPLLIRGVGTHFESPQFEVGGTIALPKVDGEAATAEIVEIISNEEIRLKRKFRGRNGMKQLTGRDDVDKDGKLTNGDANGSAKGNNDFKGTSFKVAPKVDQTDVYEAVFERLNRGGCIGIFPEGGSHDRTTLLPLKAGVAIMALGALAQAPHSGLKIVPCGMNYFHAHKFRSRAVIEFGNAIELPMELVEQFRKGGEDKRNAVGETLDIVFAGLKDVTVQAPDYETLMMIQAVRRLYRPKDKKLPLSRVVELNRRLVLGYDKFKNDPRIISLKKDVIQYNKQLMALNIRDHQVEYAKMPIIKVVFFLFYRTTKLLLLSIGVLPGLILFSPVFIVGKVISIRKSKEALAASSVKIKARDVVATWKLLVAMALAPTLYTLYTCLLAFMTWDNRVWGYVPDYVPIWTVFVFGMIFFPTITYAALRFGEIGMDIFKSLRPLFLALQPSSGNTLVKLRKRRTELAADVTDLINTLGPEVFEDFDTARIIDDPYRTGTVEEHVSRYHHRYASEPDGFNDTPRTPTHEREHSGFLQLTPMNSGRHNIPHNESFSNLGGIGLFASRPGTPTSKRERSRTNSSGGFGVQGFTTLDGEKDGLPFDEVSKRIRGAMKERGERRRSGTGTRELAGSLCRGSMAFS